MIKNGVNVKGVEIGVGMPKICVSILGKTEEQIYKQAKKIKEKKVDLAEWRMDYWELPKIMYEKEKLEQILQGLVDIFENIPIITTFRTKEEGGEKEISKEDYKKLQELLIKNSKVDILDMELDTVDSFAKELVEAAHLSGKKVILSSHDFFKTPKQEEIVKRFCRMQKLGADLPKIAVMPKSSKDVLDLLSAAEEMQENYQETPIISMAMGRLGMISRLSGEVFGSAVTFGCMEQSSAPGQIEVEQLRSVLELLHG